MPITRSRRDRCPGAWRPWPAEDGLLVRLRLVGGRLPVPALLGVVDVAERYGDGRVHVTGRANLQLRALPSQDGSVPAEVMTALEATGLLPSRSHELVRNLMVSPASGRDGGRADLRPIAEALDRELCADPVLAGLPGRFLFVLDDGRGDVVERPCDLGLVALDADSAQLRVGDGWGDVVPLSDAPARLLDLARRFLERRGAEADAAWHVAELDDPLVEPRATDPRVPPGRAPMPYGPVACGLHVAVPREGLHRTDLAWLPEHPGPSGSPEGSADVVVTPWHGILVPEARS